jgi:hypothetical protein
MEMGPMLRTKSALGSQHAEGGGVTLQEGGL